ncbi:hypothetical protein KCP71_13465 [Salmonella enterica subsp. enterica]|nr:hypothetical protein KCP71_13465 [Salmonella enterica subsp. enterica]
MPQLPHSSQKPLRWGHRWPGRCNHGQHATTNPIATNPCNNAAARVNDT